MLRSRTGEGLLSRKWSGPLSVLKAHIKVSLPRQASGRVIEEGLPECRACEALLLAEIDHLPTQVQPRYPITGTQNPNPETRNPKSGTRNPKPETRNPEPEIRNPKPETRNLKPETRNPEPEDRNPKSEIRNPKPGTRNPESKREASMLPPLMLWGGVLGRCFLMSEVPL